MGSTDSRIRPGFIAGMARSYGKLIGGIPYRRATWGRLGGWDYRKGIGFDDKAR